MSEESDPYGKRIGKEYRKEQRGREPEDGFLSFLCNGAQPGVGKNLENVIKRLYKNLENVITFWFPRVK